MNVDWKPLAAGIAVLTGLPAVPRVGAEDVLKKLEAGVAEAIELRPKKQIAVNNLRIVQGGGAQVVVANGQVVVLGDGTQPEHMKRSALPFDAAGGHVLEFVDGSQLHGTVDAISETEVVVKRSDASAPIVFPAAMLSRIILDNEGDPDAAPPRSTLQFNSGDWMTANVLLLREGKAELRLGPQRLTVDQSKIDWISFSEGKAPDVFTGPDSLDGWITGGAWTIRDGALVSKQIGNLGRNFAAVPERLDIQWDMAAGEVQRNFMLSFNYSLQGPKGNASNAWTQVRFNEGQLYLYTATQNKNQNFSIDLPRSATRKAEDGKLHYRVLHDRTGGRMAVYVNGRKITEQKVPPMAAGSWSGVMNFQPMRWSSDAQWEISKIKLQPWDGQLPADGAPLVPNRLDILSLADGTVKSGRVEGLLGGVLKFKSASGEEVIPRDKMAMLRLRKPEESPPAEAASGPRILLADRGEWKLKSLRLKDGVFTLCTTFAGDLTLPKSAVYSIVFPNPLPDKIEPADRLVFKNGDQLRGTLSGAGSGRPVSWRLTNGTGIEFDIKRLGGILLTPRDAAEKAADADMVVRFRNGDWLGGTLVGIDKEAVKFQTAFAREVRVERSRVQSVYLSKAGERPVWEGAEEPDAWWKGHQGPNQGWYSSGTNGQPVGLRSKVYLDGAFLLPGQNGNQNGIGRLLDKLPDRVEVSFEAASEQMAPAFSLQLFYSKQGNTGLMAQVWQGGMYVYDMEPRRGRGAWGGQPVQVQWGEKINSSARRHVFRIFADRKARRAAFFVDGVQITQFIRKGPKDEKESDDSRWGTGISLHPQGANVPMIFSNLWISPWNGQLPSAAQKEAVESVSLANGDEAMARVESATPQSFKLDFEGEPLELPRDRVVMIDFGAAPAAEPAPEAKPEPAAGPAPAPETTPETGTPLRLRLAKGGTITVDSMKLENGEVTCSSGSFGELKLPLASFSEIIWNRLDSGLEGTAAPPRPARRVPKK